MVTVMKFYCELNFLPSIWEILSFNLHNPIKYIPFYKHFTFLNELSLIINYLDIFILLSAMT